MDKRKSTMDNGGGNRPLISTGVGASDDSSGGGNASGIPDADTAMRPGGSPPPGNLEEDRRKLFPGSTGGRSASKAKGKSKSTKSQ